MSKGNARWVCAGVLLSGLAGCAAEISTGTAGSRPDAGAASSGGDSKTTTGSATGVATGTSSEGGQGNTSNEVVGRLLVTTVMYSNGQGLDTFDVNLQPMMAPASFCAGAIRTVGDCCYFPPSPPPGLQPFGSGMPATQPSAGAISLLDATLNKHVGTYLYSNGGYDLLSAMYAGGTWNAGDELVVSATGDQIGAFRISAPALSAPSAVMPTTVIRDQPLEVTWSADPNSETMSIQVLDTNTGAVVACSVPDAQQSVTIDASLFASFAAGDQCQTAADREADHYVQTSMGSIELSTGGWTSVGCSIQ